MKICAITMVYRDYWALSQWYAHYGRHLGHENLYIVSHGPDPEIARLCPQASVITIPRDGFAHFDAMRNRMLNDFQRGLVEVYDWVIRTDADELICLAPEHHSSFHDLLSRQDANAVFALGLNVAEHPDDPELKDGELALAKRRSAMFSGHYSKAWVVRKRVGLMRHGIEVRPRFAARHPFVMPRGVYLAHLKFANTQALSAANRIRREIANSTGSGLPGAAWKDPASENRKFFDMMDALPHQDWSQAETAAYELLSQDPVRDTNKGLIRARSIKGQVKTTLPQWFASA
ncbi:glycosyltransferase family 2 protein [Tropicibacter sp. R16_0]|uniref:glycosyltransferase family 2 protein n=1 Tax=Tropicibacter sp. R16_0 TaxID=2821102 RepID=UPI001ADB409A|nr:glycosyltransferase family 2 protein [Tropicibacter sp. R16_0]MBO9449168.1 glycosyltransferase family 2 protein [Tropicibacter sp. R16_0]